MSCERSMMLLVLTISFFIVPCLYTSLCIQMRRLLMCEETTMLLTQVDHSDDRIRSNLSRFRHSFCRFQQVPIGSGGFLVSGFRPEVEGKFPVTSWPYPVGRLSELNGTSCRNVERNPVTRKSSEQKPNRPEPTEHQ